MFVCVCFMFLARAYATSRLKPVFDNTPMTTRSHVVHIKRNPWQNRKILSIGLGRERRRGRGTTATAAAAAAAA
jgi:hypothetical protein